MNTDTHVRLVRTRPDGDMKLANRSAIRRIELVRDGEVVGLLKGVSHLEPDYGLSDIQSLRVTLAVFEEVFE